MKENYIIRKINYIKKLYKNIKINPLNYLLI